MADLLALPSTMSDFDNMFIDQETGKLKLPRLIVSLLETPMYYQDLNKSADVQRRITKYFHTKAQDKWLYNDASYESLLKYFVVTKSNKEITVDLIKSMKDATEKKWTDDERKYIFQFIEKYFLTKKFVYKVLRDYVKATNVNWYDLYTNSHVIKSHIRHKLKSKIEKVIYELQRRDSK